MLAAGEFSKTYTVTPDDDEVDEAAGSLTVRTADGWEGSNHHVAITINDNDLPKIRLLAVASRVTEGYAVFFYVLRYGTELPLPATRIEVGVGFHTKIFADDATLPATTRYLDFAEDQYSATLVAGITHDDELNEGDGMIRADLQVSASEYNIIDRGEAWTRVIDNDVPEVTLSVTKNSVVEGEDNAWHVTRDCCADNNLPLANASKWVQFYPNDYWPDNVQEATRTEPTAFHFAGHISPGDLTTVFNAAGLTVGPLGGYEQRRILEFPADSFEGIPFELDPTFNPRYTVTSTEWFRVDVQNNTPGVEIESAQDSVTEGDTMNFVFTRYGGPPDFINQFGHRLRIDVAQTGNYLAASELGERTVTFSPQQTSVQLAIPTNGDGFDLADGTVTLTILEGADTDLTEDTYDFNTHFSDLQNRYIYKTTVDILDDDQFGVTVSQSELMISEGDEGTYTVVLDTGPAASVTVTPSRTSGDADVTVSGALTFTTSDWNVAQTVTVSAAPDNDTDNDAAVIGHGVSGGNFDSFAAGSVRVTVNDAGASSNGVTLSVSPTEVAESSGATSVTVTATLSDSTRALATPVAVTVGSGTATSGTDFTAVSGFTITIPANELSHTGTFSLDPTQDTVYEPDETLLVGGSSTVPGIGVTGTEVRIFDDGAAPTVTLLLSPNAIRETDDSGTPGVEEHKTTVTASLNHASSVATTVTISVDLDSPATSSDYSLSAGKVLTIAAGSTSSTGSVTITAVNNDVDEADKTVTVTGTATAGFGIVNPADVRLTLSDDDIRGVTISETSLEIDEGGTAAYTVVLDTRPTASVTVTPSRTSGDTDVTVSGALTFTTGNWNAAQTVTVSVAADNDLVGETAVIGHTVSGGDYASVAVNSVSVTVSDTTVLPEITIAGPESITEGGDITFTISRTGAATDELVMDFNISSIGAGRFVFPSSLGNKSVTINAGSASAEYTISTLDDISFQEIPAIRRRAQLPPVYRSVLRTTPSARLARSRSR